MKQRAVFLLVEMRLSSHSLPPPLPPLSLAGMATSRGSIGKSSSNSSQEDPVTDVRLQPSPHPQMEGLLVHVKVWRKGAGECMVLLKGTWKGAGCFRRGHGKGRGASEGDMERGGVLPKGTWKEAGCFRRGHGKGRGASEGDMERGGVLPKGNCRIRALP